MHEYSIIQALVQKVDDQVRAHQGARVRRLTVRIGELSGVEVDLLEAAFENFRQQTVCARADLVIESVPARWMCPKCDAEIAVGSVLRCRGCDVPARLVEGDEIILDRIEMEVLDV